MRASERVEGRAHCLLRVKEEKGREREKGRGEERRREQPEDFHRTNNVTRLFHFPGVKNSFPLYRGSLGFD
jgi:hypothetical protein